MPYIPRDDRPILNTSIDKLAEEITQDMIKHNQDAEISVKYKNKIVAICDTIYNLARSRVSEPKSVAEELGHEIFNVAKKYGYKGAWKGELNYALTTLIQVVPFKMVKRGKWKEELRYWLYAGTVGALVRASDTVNDIYKSRLDKQIDKLAGEIASNIFSNVSGQNDKHIKMLGYKKEIAKMIHDKITLNSEILFADNNLANEVIDVAKNYGHAATDRSQNSEFIAGVIANSELVDMLKYEWVINGLVGTPIDVKDEYKRRVNPAYESVQINKSGDCYITPYHTELEEVKDDKGNVTGWREIEKDFRTTHIVKEKVDEKGNVIGWEQVIKGSEKQIIQ